MRKSIGHSTKLAMERQAGGIRDGNTGDGASNEGLTDGESLVPEHGLLDLTEDKELDGVVEDLA